MRIVRLRFHQKVEQFAVGASTQALGRGEDVEKYRHGGQTLGMRTNEGLGLAANIGFGTPMVATAEALQEFVIFAARDFHLLQAVGFTRQVHFFAGHGHERERGEVGIDQSEEHRFAHGAIVAEGAARQANAVCAAPVGGAFDRSIGDDRGLIHSFDVAGEARGVLVGAARGEQPEGEQEREEKT